MSYFSSVAKKAVQTVNHSYIYIRLLPAACFSFCGKSFSGKRRT